MSYQNCPRTMKSPNPICDDNGVGKPSCQHTDHISDYRQEEVASNQEGKQKSADSKKPISVRPPVPLPRRQSSINSHKEDEERPLNHSLNEPSSEVSVSDQLVQEYRDYANMAVFIDPSSEQELQPSDPVPSTLGNTQGYYNLFIAGPGPPRPEGNSTESFQMAPVDKRPSASSYMYS